MPTEGPGDPAAADGVQLTMKISRCRTQWNQGFIAFQPETLHAQIIRLAVSDIVIFMGQCG
jgi:hypothetical protein